MKKHRKAKIFLEELSRTSIISVTCQKLGLSRNTIYRWRSEDRGFALAMDEAMKHGEESINDLAESQLVKKIQQSDLRAMRYWLDNHHLKYSQRRSKEDQDKKNKITGFNITVRHAAHSPTIIKGRAPQKDGTDWPPKDDELFPRYNPR